MLFIYYIIFISNIIISSLPFYSSKKAIIKTVTSETATEAQNNNKKEILKINKDYCKNYTINLKKYDLIDIPSYKNNYQPDKKKYAIFSLAYKYYYNKYYFFINSIKKTNYSGKIFLFVNEDLDEKIRKYLVESDVKLLYLTREWPFYSENNEEYKLNSSILEKYVPKFISRSYWLHSISRYLLLNALSIVYNDMYEIGLLVDFKDVFIQINPFSWNIPNGISLFEESRGITYENEKYDLNWVIAVNKSKKYFKDKKYYIINAGQVFFTYPDILYFLDEYRKLVITTENINKTSDQSYFNIIYYEINYKHRKFTLFKTYFGPARILAGDIIYLRDQCNIPIEKIVYHELLDFKNGKIVNCDGTIPVIIHFFFYLKGSANENEIYKVIERIR